MSADFIVCPGEVISQTDGDVHFISAFTLINLYGVKRTECVIMSPSTARMEGLYVLDPRFDGDYSLPDVLTDPCEPYHISDTICAAAAMSVGTFLSTVLPV